MLKMVSLYRWNAFDCQLCQMLIEQGDEQILAKLGKPHWWVGGTEDSSLQQSCQDKHPTPGARRPGYGVGLEKGWGGWR